MKKLLLLSAAASAVIYAGGDITPIEPSAPATADFWGQIGFFYQAEDSDLLGWDMGDKENNWFSATVVLGVDKQFGNGFGFGAEVAGWSGMGFDIGDRTLFKTVPLIATVVDDTSAEVSQAYLTYSFGNTAIKAGRQALPKAVSPWAWSDRTGGVVDFSYDGVVIANTDIAGTTLVAAWVDQTNAADPVDNVDVSDKYGLYMLSAINKSIAENTTIAVSGYYIPKSQFVRDYQVGRLRDGWSLWASVENGDDALNWGLQAAYVDGDGRYANGNEMGETFAVSGKIGSSWGDFDTEFVAGYINGGAYSLKNAGSGLGTSAVWTFNGDYGGDAVLSEDQWSVIAKAGYRLPVGKLYGNLGYWSYDDDATHTLQDAFDARAGYKFTVSGLSGNIEYRYLTQSFNNMSDKDRQRVRVEAYYKF